MTNAEVAMPGEKAPEFSLYCTPDQKVSLREFLGQPVVLAFYPADWSPVCGDELALFNEILPELEQWNAGFLGISVDSVWCHLAYRKDRNLRFPLLSDFEPKGEVARAYGAYRESSGFCERGLFVIDAAGKLHWRYISPVGINPGANGVLQALRELPLAKKEVAYAK